jgi:hypothetical protein
MLQLARNCGFSAYKVLTRLDDLMEELAEPSDYTFGMET